MNPRALAAAAAMVVQGPLLAFLSHQPPGGYSVLSVAAAALALGVYSLGAHARQRAIRQQALMASIGSFAMLVGWLAEAGFKPLVGSGLCLCGCTDSLAGLGVIAHLHWMQGLMLASCAVSTLALEHPGRRTSGWGPSASRILASSVAMLVGMAVGGWAAGGWHLEDPTTSLLVSYLAMSAGMTTGSSLLAWGWPRAGDPPETNESFLHRAPGSDLTGGQEKA